MGRYSINYTVVYTWTACWRVQTEPCVWGGPARGRPCPPGRRWRCTWREGLRRAPASSAAPAPSTAGSSAPRGTAASPRADLHAEHKEWRRRLMCIRMHGDKGGTGVQTELLRVTQPQSGLENKTKIKRTDFSAHPKRPCKKNKKIKYYVFSIHSSPDYTRPLCFKWELALCLSSCVAAPIATYPSTSWPEPPSTQPLGNRILMCDRPRCVRRAQITWARSDTAKPKCPHLAVNAHQCDPISRVALRRQSVM